MRTLLVALIASVVSFGIAATTGLGSTPPKRVGPFCASWTEHGYSCTLPDPSSVRTSYAIQIDGLDLYCVLHSGISKLGTVENFSCERGSRVGGSCTEGYFESLTTYMTALTMQMWKPATCVPTNDAVGKLVSWGKHYTFNRVP